MKYYYYAVEKGNNVYALQLHTGCNPKRYMFPSCANAKTSASVSSSSPHVPSKSFSGALLFVPKSCARLEKFSTIKSGLTMYIAIGVYEVKFIQKSLSPTSVYHAMRCDVM